MNLVQLVGRLGNDPEVRTTTNGAKVCSFRLATREREKQGDAWVEAVEWHSIVCFGRDADNLAQYKKKGDELAIVGKMKTRSWEKDGVKMKSTEIIADRIEYVGGRADGANASAPPPRQAPAASSRRAPEPKVAPTYSDDVPF